MAAVLLHRRFLKSFYFKIVFSPRIFKAFYFKSVFRNRFSMRISESFFRAKF